jgi:hypothetical protein
MAWIGSSSTGERAAQIGASIELESQRATLLLDLGLPVLLGFIGALLQSCIKLHILVPGHAAVLWVTPLLVARALSASSAAGSVASTSTALGMCALGGFSLRLPLVLNFGTFWLVGPILDLFTLALGRWTRTAEQRRSLLAGPLGLLVLPAAGLVVNLAHLALKLAAGVPPRAGQGLGLGGGLGHGARRAAAAAAEGLSSGWPPVGLYALATYTVFGLAAGVVAYLVCRPLLNRRVDTSRENP